MTTRVNSEVDTYGMFAFKDTLLLHRAEDITNWIHREAGIRYDWLLNVYIDKLTDEIFEERIITVPDIFGGEFDDVEDDDEYESENIIESEESDEGGDDNDIIVPQVNNVLEDYTNEKWTDLLKKLIKKARTHSFSVVRLYNDFPFWRVYTHREIQWIKYEHNIPVSVHVKYTRDLPFTSKENFKEYEETFDLTNPNKITDAILISNGGVQENELGIFDIDHLWSLDIYLRYQRLDVVVNSAKTSGWHHFVYGESYSEAKHGADMALAADQVSSSRAIGVKKSILDEVKTYYPAKPEFTVFAKDDIMRDFASACRLPLSYFRAEIEHGGMFSMDNMDIYKINLKKKHVFSNFTESIIKLIEMRWGVIIDDVYPCIEEIEVEEIEIDTEKPDEGNENEFENNEKNEDEKDE